MAYDGRRALYSTSQAVLQPKYEFVIADEKDKKEDMTLTIELVAQKKVADLINSISQKDTELPSDILQALDIALHHNLSQR